MTDVVNKLNYRSTSQHASVSHAQLSSLAQPAPCFFQFPTWPDHGTTWTALTGLLSRLDRPEKTPHNTTAELRLNTGNVAMCAWRLKPVGLLFLYGKYVNHSFLLYTSRSLFYNRTQHVSCEHSAHSAKTRTRTRLTAHNSSVYCLLLSTAWSNSATGHDSTSSFGQQKIIIIQIVPRLTCHSERRQFWCKSCSWQIDGSKAVVV